MNIFLAFVLTWLTPHETRSPVLNAEKSGIEYFCEPIAWTHDLEKDPADGLFKGSVQSDCSYFGENGGGINTVETFVNDKVRADANPLHAGPIATTYKGTPGTYYDVSLKYGGSGSDALVREDLQFTNQEARDFYMSAKSKSIQAKGGNGKYLKTLDITTWIGQGSSAGWFRVRVTSDFSVEKPWYYPTDMFRNEIRTQIQEAAPQTQIKLVTELANHS